MGIQSRVQHQNRDGSQGCEAAIQAGHLGKRRSADGPPYARSSSRESVSGISEEMEIGVIGDNTLEPTHWNQRIGTNALETTRLQSQTWDLWLQ
jgi:hypothetical protein